MGIYSQDSKNAQGAAYGKLDSTAIEIPMEETVRSIHIAIDSSGSITGTATITYRPPGFVQALSFDSGEVITIADNKAKLFELDLIDLGTLIITPSGVSAPANWRVVTG